MARVLYLHGSSADPTFSPKVEALRRVGHDVLAPKLDYEHARFSTALRTARAAFDSHRPHVVVGSSLGGGVAMSLDAGGGVPLVLVSPAWDLSQIRVPADLVAGKSGNLAALAAAAGGSVSPAVAAAVGEMWGFDVPASVPAETVILHAADDDMVEARHSRTLLGRGPQPAEGSPVHRVLAELREQGYQTDASEPRLVTIGSGHKCNHASATCPGNPGRSPVACLAAAVTAWAKALGV